MPFTVITMTNAPKSLRGDLSKWMQEIATGVYVGNFNKKVREALWKRVSESIGDGEATMSYSTRNEIGYDFETINTDRQVVDFDGIPLVLFDKEYGHTKEDTQKTGYSNASIFHQAKKYTRVKTQEEKDDIPYVVIDIETDGLDADKDNIIEIAAIKIEKNKKEEFSRLIKTNVNLPKSITDLTGINDKMLKSKGKDLEEVLLEFMDFISSYDLVGYNIDFDIRFINKSLLNLNISTLKNKTYDLMRYVKKEKKFLSNYKLTTVLKEYEIDEEIPHRALEDSWLIYKLSLKVKKFQDKIK